MSGRGRVVALFCAGSLAGAVGVAFAGTHDAASVWRSLRREILMKAIAFTPGELKVDLGDTVVFKNADVVRHNAVRRELFDSGELRPGESFVWVPTDTGSYRYQCTIHPRMRGIVRVDSLK